MPRRSYQSSSESFDWAPPSGPMSGSILATTYARVHTPDSQPQSQLQGPDDWCVYEPRGGILVCREMPLQAHGRHVGNKAPVIPGQAYVCPSVTGKHQSWRSRTSCATLLSCILYSSHLSLLPLHYQINWLFSEPPTDCRGKLYMCVASKNAKVNVYIDLNVHGSDTTQKLNIDFAILKFIWHICSLGINRYR